MVVLNPDARSGFSTWRGPISFGNVGNSPAGFYAALISVPLYRLMLLRWLWLGIAWAVFLRRVTKLPLHCPPAHPDCAGGLGFLGRTQMFFGIISFAVSAVMAGAFANQITYEGSSIEALKFQMVGFCAFVVFLSVTPLLMLTPRLIEVEDRGLHDYHKLGMLYTAGFDRKWIRNERPGDESLLGSSDIQSLADLANSYMVVKKMRPVLLDREILIGLAVPPVLPMLVLLATATPMDQLMKEALRVLG
jgi:hypothetical protein